MASVRDELSLAPLAPVSTTVHAAGEVLQVAPANLLTLAEMAQHVRPLMAALEGAAPDTPLAQTLLPSLLDRTAAEGLVHAAALGCGRTPEWVSALTADEQLTLIITVIEVNLDFFVQRLQPLLVTGLQRTLTRLLAGRT